MGVCVPYRRECDQTWPCNLQDHRMHVTLTKSRASYTELLGFSLPTAVRVGSGRRRTATRRRRGRRASGGGGVPGCRDAAREAASHRHSLFLLLRQDKRVWSSSRHMLSLYLSTVEEVAPPTIDACVAHTLERFEPPRARTALKSSQTPSKFERTRARSPHDAPARRARGALTDALSLGSLFD